MDAHVVLTAAHCVEGRTVENLRARVGEWDAGRVVFMVQFLNGIILGAELQYFFLIQTKN